MEILFQIHEPFSGNIDKVLIERALVATLQQLDYQAEGTVSLVVTDNETSRRLNHTYRGIEAPTDVLSFANEADPDFPDPLLADHLGDIIIAYPLAQSQALAAGHTPAEEICLLVVHGLLHLLGFDHDTAENKARMWTIQQAVMTKLGLAHVHPTET